MVRERVVASAVAFLREPSVASSTADQRIAFLRSKNLTQEEIDAALAQAGQPSAQSNQIPQNISYPPNQFGSQYFRDAPHAYSYSSQWGQPPPPPRRDWRDWFIMATVTTTVGYGLYAAAKRYVLPLISPPTPPQLEADKAAVDASFDRAFALIDQLSADTAALKAAEEERTEKLDASLTDIESVIDELKAANRQREQDARQVADQVRDLRDMIPKALNRWKEREDNKLGDIGSEMQSLKRLMENKVGLRASSSSSSYSEGNRFGISSGPKSQEKKDETADQNATKDVDPKNGERAGGKGDDERGSLSISSSSGFRREQSTGYRPNSKAAIPAWQMAAANNDTGQPVPANQETSVEASA